MSRRRMPGSWATHVRTWAWFVRKSQSADPVDVCCWLLEVEFMKCMIHCLLHHSKEANHGRSRHHLSIPDTGPAFGVSAAVTDARRVADP
jgi:hypothetical protein